MNPSRSPAPAPRSRSWRTYSLVFLLALSLRGGWGAGRWARSDQRAALEFPDEEQYWGMAGALRRGEGLKDELGFQATRMPLYPALLAPFTGSPNGILLARSLHWVLGALAAVLTAALAARLHPRAGTIAGLLVALDPFLIFFSSSLLTETAFVAALLALWLALWNATRAKTLAPWIPVGLLAVVCVYLRESSAGLLLLGMGFVVVVRRFAKGAIAGALLACGMIVLSLVPWAARNRAVTGDWCWLTHRGGISLYDGVRPGASGGSDLGEVKRSAAVRDFDEVAWDRYFWKEAVAVIRAEPGRVARLALIKVGRMWNPVPNVETYRSAWARAVSAGWSIPVFTLAVVGFFLVSIQWRGEGVRASLYLLLPALYFTALHSLFVGSVRYRLPAMPMVEILAAVAMAAAYNRRAAAPRSARTRTTGASGAKGPHGH